MKIAILLATLACLRAQSALDRPALGQMLDQHNRLRPVYGVGGSFHVDAPIADQVISSACSHGWCLAKKNSALLSAGVATPAPPGEAIIAVDSTGATIYFPQTQQFARWQNGSLTMLNQGMSQLSVYGSVLALGSNSSGLTIAVERSGIVWIVSSNGTILDSLPPGAASVLLTANGVAYANSSALILRKSDGSELSFPGAGIQDLFALGDGYVEARAGDVLYAL